MWEAGGPTKLYTPLRVVKTHIIANKSFGNSGALTLNSHIKFTKLFLSSYLD